MIAALIALVLQLLAHQPAPAVQTPPTPAVLAPAPAPVVSQPYGDAPRAHDAPTGRPGPAPVTVPTCEPGEEWQGEFGCVALQLPEETIGRQYDPAN